MRCAAGTQAERRRKMITSVGHWATWRQTRAWRATQLPRATHVHGAPGAREFLSKSQRPCRCTVAVQCMKCGAMQAGSDGCNDAIPFTRLTFGFFGSDYCPTWTHTSCPLSRMYSLPSASTDAPSHAANLRSAQLAILFRIGIDQHQVARFLDHEQLVVARSHEASVIFADVFPSSRAVCPSGRRCSSRSRWG